MKSLKKLVSLFLAFLFVMQLFPIKYIGNFAVKAFALEKIETISEYDFKIPKETVNTVDVKIPETIIEPAGYIYEEVVYEYEYDNKLSEKENRFFEIIFENNCFSELTNDEKAFICSYISLNERQLDMLEKRDYSLVASANIVDLAKKAEKTFNEVVSLNLSPGTILKILKEFHFYLENVDDSILGTNTDKTIRSYLLRGYSVEEAVNAYSVSQSIDIETEDLLSEENSEEESSLSEDELTKLKDFASQYSVSPSAIISYAEENDVTAEEIEESSESIDDNIESIIETDSTTAAADGSVEEVYAPYYYKYDENENVSLNTG